MNKSAIVATAALGIVAAASAGFWVGANRPLADRTAATATTAGSVAAPGQSAANAAPTTVEATKVAVMAMPQSITAVGSLRSDESITVRPEVAGRISAILFREGQQVGKGMTLVRLDPAINQAEVQQARANLKLAQTKYDRAVELSQRNFISGQAKDEAENNLRVAQAALSLVEARLAKTEIRAPFAGMIGLRVVSVGDYVKEGADIVNLESIDPLKVDFRVPEVYLRQVQEGQTLTVTLDALPGKKFEGKVYAVNPLVDFSLGPDGRLRFENAAVKAGVADSPAGAYTASWFHFDNDTGETTAVGAPVTGVADGLEAPAGLTVSPGGYIKVQVAAVNPVHPSWAKPVDVYFRREETGWKLVGLER